MKRYDEYQNTRVKWMGSIPAHWNFKRLKSILQIRKERNDPVITKNILSLTAKQGVVPYVEKEDRGGNKPKENFTDYFIAHEGDLLVNCMNVVSGAAGVSKYFGAVSPVYYPLYPRGNENVWYYHHIFRLITFQRSLVGLGKGIMMHESDNGILTTVRKRISMDSLGNVLLPIPPRDEQDQIVRYLDWKVSEINKLIVAKKKEFTQIGELKKTIVSEAVTHGLHKGVQMKFSGVEWLGDIPAHWTTVKLRRILRPFSEKNHPDLPLLSVVREQGVIVRDVDDKEANHNFIPDDLSGYKLVKKGQFAMNKMKAWQGSYGVSDYTGIVSPAYFVFDVDFENLQYFHYAIRSKVYVNFFAQASDGIRVGQWDLSMPKMKEIPFIVPPLNEQQEIVDYIPKAFAQYDETIKKLSDEIEKLQELKNRIISDTVTGQIDVRGVDIPDFDYVEDINDDEPFEETGNSEEEV